MTSTDTTSTAFTSRTTHTAVICGEEGEVVAVTARRTAGLPSFDITGLRNSAARETHVRVRSAISLAGFAFPSGRVTLSFDSHALVDGTASDLAGAVAILAAAGHLEDACQALQTVAFFAELSLSGELRPCRGALPAAVAARNAHLSSIIVAKENLAEASLAGLKAYAATTLTEVLQHLLGQTPLHTLAHVDPALELASAQGASDHTPDFADVRGQPHAVRAMEVAAAGGHHTLLIGGPGAGKTMLARRLPSILPPLTLDEANEVTTLASVAGLNIGAGIVGRRPFRAPHHSTTPAGLIGGGAPVARPGEVSLAHHGVLFLDELTEFSRQTLESLREPLHTGQVQLCRSTGTVTYRARAQVVASTNPCPCGLLFAPRMRCRCTAPDVQRFTARINSALAETFSIRCRVDHVDLSVLDTATPSEPSVVIRKRVVRARERQMKRAGKLNSTLTKNDVSELSIDPRGRAVLQTALTENRVRHQTSLLAVARTVADLAGEDTITAEHIAEALSWH
jgi:magnesium chelatase family protein